MKKSLIAVAALAATGAFAQSSVTVYGNIDMGFGTQKTTSRDGSAFTKSAGVMDGSWAGSRIGFRGTEDLGGGLRASFVAEQGINPTSNNGFNQRVASSGNQIGNAATGNGSAYADSNNRQTYLGLAGGFGEVRIGYQYTNSYDVVAFQGYSLSEFQGGNYQNQTHANGTRSNAITYIAPTLMQGLTLKGQFGSGTGRGTVEGNVAANVATNAGGTGVVTATNNNEYTSLMALYATGPLSVSYAYSRSALETTTARTQTSHNLGGSYNAGFATISATIGDLNDGAAAETTTKAQQFSVKVPMGALELLASTGSAKRTTVGTAGAAYDSKGTMVGVNYTFSKRTNMYALTGTDKNAAITAANGAGYKDSKTIVGVRHQF